MNIQEQINWLNKKLIGSAKGTNDKMDGNVADLNTSIEKVNVTQSIAFVTLAEAGQIDSVTAGENIDMFEAWNYPIAYKIGQLRQHNGILYKCIQDHTSQEDWTPDNAVSLWTTTADPTEEYPQWSQPVGAHDAYMTGDKVTYNDLHYISIVDNNVWQPDVYGWELVVEETETQAGTLDNPVAVSAEMLEGGATIEYTKGLYYIEDETLYLMNREGMADGDTISLAYLPSQLVGQYFEVAE